MAILKPGNGYRRQGILDSGCCRGTATCALCHGVSSAKMDLETKTQTSRPCGQTEMQLSPSGSRPAVSTNKPLGISTSYFTSGGTFPPHRASSHVGGKWLPCRRWNTGATSPQVSFYWCGETSTEINTVCPSRGQGSSPSTHPQDSSQLSVTLIPEDPKPSSDFHGHETHLYCTYINAGKTLKHIK